MMFICVFIQIKELLVIVIALNVIHQSKGDCGDDVRKPTEGHDCCTNYHMVDGFCKACPHGYFGNNCSVGCPHPSFGLFCGETCNCSQSECDPALGCLSEMSTHWLNYSEIVRHRNTQIPDTTYRPSILDETTELSSTTLTLIIGGVIILFLLVIILIQVHGKVTKKKNTFKKMPIKDNENPLQHETSTNSMYCEIDESEEPSVSRARYETIGVDSPPPANRKYDIPLIVIHPDISEAPPGPIQGNRNGTSIYPQDNPYLDVIS